MLWIAPVSVLCSAQKIESPLIIRFGKTTTEELRKVWGEPKITVGEHPKSGRLWNFSDGTSISTDGARAEKVGSYFIDGLGISGWPGRLGNAKPARNLPLGMLADLRVGDGPRAVAQELLHRKVRFSTFDSKMVTANQSGKTILHFNRKGLSWIKFDFRRE